MGEMTTFFLWIWRAKRDSGRGLNFSLKFGFDLFFFFFYDLLYLIYRLFSEIKGQKFSIGLLFFLFSFLGV